MTPIGDAELILAGLLANGGVLVMCRHIAKLNEVLQLTSFDCAEKQVNRANLHRDSQS